jgi:hypothetical protein
VEVFEVVEVFSFGDGGVGEKTERAQRGRLEKSSSCRQWNATREFQKYFVLIGLAIVRQFLLQHNLEI